MEEEELMEAPEGAGYAAEELTDAEVTAILQAYRSQQLKQHMIGPGVSAVLHIALVHPRACAVSYSSRLPGYRQPSGYRDQFA